MELMGDCGEGSTMSKRILRAWTGGGGAEIPLLAAIAALSFPEDTKRVALIAVDAYQREVSLAALCADGTGLLVTAPDGSRRVACPKRPISFWIKNLARIEAR
jgi:hypothetical protein